MPKFKNVSVHELVLPTLGRNVKPGDVIDVPDDLAEGFTVGEGEDPHPYWAPVELPASAPAALPDVPAVPAQ